MGRESVKERKDRVRKRRRQLFGRCPSAARAGPSETVIAGSSTFLCSVLCLLFRLNSSFPCQRQSEPCPVSVPRPVMGGHPIFGFRTQSIEVGHDDPGVGYREQ